MPVCPGQGPWETPGFSPALGPPSELPDRDQIEAAALPDQVVQACDAVLKEGVYIPEQPLIRIGSGSINWIR
jgi:hypothetical protein